MSHDEKDTQFRMRKNNPQVPCRYGAQCYQKSVQHRSKYTHPSSEETMEKKTEKIVIGAKRKNPSKNNKIKAQSQSPQRKWRKTCESPKKNSHDFSPSPRGNDVNISDDGESFNANVAVSDKDSMQASLNERHHSFNSGKCDTVENVLISHDVEKIIMDLFLVAMPKDFFQFYDFCKSLSKDNPLSACKSVCLELVGPYDVLDGKMRNLKDESDKEKYLTHWRYYYDPPEFQTVVRCCDKEGMHFGYWRDNATEEPVFVAKNRGNMNCIFESVAENIFGAIDGYLQNKAKSANPFEKMGVTRLQSQLKKFTKQHNITLEKNTADMREREKRVVARTFHKAGIVVPYDKKTQLGYRDLAATDNDLRKILEQIEKAGTSDERKAPMAKLDEIIRLATIAADECDFGTCLELGHDLFSNGGTHVQSRALQMLSIAYTHLQRPELLKIFKAHLKNRRRDCELSAI